MFDAFYTKANRICRVYAHEDWREKEQFFNTVTPFPMGLALKDNFAEVELQVRSIESGRLSEWAKIMMIALATISYQAFKTAWTMPAETLKQE